MKAGDGGWWRLRRLSDVRPTRGSAKWTRRLLPFVAGILVLVCAGFDWPIIGFIGVAMIVGAGIWWWQQENRYDRVYRMQAEVIGETFLRVQQEQATVTIRPDGETGEVEVIVSLPDL